MIYHFEGGWPKEVDVTDENEKKQFIKKKLEKNAENQDRFTPAINIMLDVVEKIISQNNQINMFEEYFDGEEPEHNIENINVKTLQIFKSLNQEVKR